MSPSLYLPREAFRETDEHDGGNACTMAGARSEAFAEDLLDAQPGSAPSAWQRAVGRPVIALAAVAGLSSVIATLLMLAPPL